MPVIYISSYDVYPRRSDAVAWDQVRGARGNFSFWLIMIVTLVFEIMSVFVLHILRTRRHVYLDLLSLSPEEDQTRFRSSKLRFFMFPANILFSPLSISPKTLNRTYLGRRQVDMILLYLQIRQAAAASIAVTSANSATSC